jgi:hypothetical protein
VRPEPAAYRAGGGWRSPGGPGRGKHADFLGLDLDLDLRQLAGEWYEGQSMPPGCRRVTGGASGCSTA